MTDSTRLLLRAGVVIAPWFLGLSIIQALTNPGFDLTKHEVSLLLAGPAGWVQTITFVVTGLLGIAYAIGVRLLLHPGRAGTWGPILLGAFGALFVIAGVLPPDPKFGFPLGAPEDMPLVQSASSNLHSLAFSALAAVTIAACFVLARRFRADGARGWANFSVVAAVAIVVCVAAGSALMSTGRAGLALLGAAVAITGWVSASALHLLRTRRLVFAAARDGAGSASR